MLQMSVKRPDPPDPDRDAVFGEKRYYSRFLRILLLCGAATLGGCNWVVLDPKGQVGMDERSIIITATWLMLIVVVPVIALTFAFAWKYRASNLRAEYSPDWDRSYKVAAVMVLVPCAIVVFLAFLTWRTTHELDPYRPIASDVQAIDVEVVALDWKWLFIYPDQKIAAVNEVAFPVNVPVNFRITSASVMNSFFIPQLGGQIYAMSGMQTKLSLIANQLGTYDGMSANYSGGGFSDMKFKAIAMTNEEFVDWVAKARKSPKELGATVYEALAKPSEKNPVEYFSYVDGQLYQGILHEARGDSASLCTASRE
jgi:cytochrome o ubiquinol oxidase subunit II